MIFLFLMIDFSFKASDGMWIDYARSGRLSEHRFLVHQYYGKKGVYDQGAHVLIIDHRGDELYRIPEADDAWVIRNGLLGSEDVYLFQNRRDTTWYLWHHEHGSVPIEGDLNLGRRGTYSMKITEKGNLYFLTEHEASVEIEELQIRNETFGSVFKDGLKYVHRSHRIEGRPQIAMSGRGYYFYFQTYASLNAQATNFLFYAFDKPGGGAIENVQLGVRFLTMHPVGDWYQLYQDSFGLIFHDGVKPVLAFSGEDQNSAEPKDAARRFFDLMLSASAKGAMLQEGGKLKFIYDGKLHVFDQTSFHFKVYPLPGKWRSIKGWRHPHRNPVIEVNHQRMKVTTMPVYQFKNLTPEQSIRLDERFSPNQRRFMVERETVIER